MEKLDLGNKKVELLVKKNMIDEQLDAIALMENLEKLVNKDFNSTIYNYEEAYLHSPRAFTYFLMTTPELNRIYGDAAYMIEDEIGKKFIHDVHLAFMIDNNTGVDMLLKEEYYEGKENDVTYHLQMGGFKSEHTPMILYHPASMASGVAYVEIIGKVGDDEKYEFALFDTPNKNYSSISGEYLPDVIGTIDVEERLCNYAKEYNLTAGESRKPM